MFRMKDRIVYLDTLLTKDFDYSIDEEFLINRENVGVIKISKNWSEYKISIKNLKKGVNTVRITFEKGFSPSSLKQSDDQRVLYCCFKRFLLL